MKSRAVQFVLFASLAALTSGGLILGIFGGCKQSTPEPDVVVTTSTINPPSAPDGMVPASPAAACVNMAAKGCPEAGDGGVDCVAFLGRAAQLETVPVACLAGAKDVAALRACGGDDKNVAHLRCLP